MKSFNIRTFIFVSSVILAVFSQETERFRPVYDVVHTVGDLNQNIRIEQNFDDYKKELNNNELTRITDLEKLQWLIGALKNTSNTRCVQDLMYTASNIKWGDPTKQWALQMIDAFGKPESGILTGNTKWIGEFDECRNVYAPLMPNSTTVGGFHGKYCSLQFTLAAIFPMNIGLCLPETCNPSDFMQHNESVINSSFTKGNFSSAFQLTSFTCKANTRKLSNGGIATICLISIFVLLAFLGSSITVLEYLTTRNARRDSVISEVVDQQIINQSKTFSGDDDEQVLIVDGSRTKLSVFIEGSKSFLNCFCVFTNGSKLLNTDSTEGQLLCLHGIRFLSMSWVIVCHTYGSPVAALRSLVGIVDKIDNWPFQVILNGFYSVDSFFVLSGFLLSYLYFQECAKKKGKTPWLYFYVHRYIRLTPVYMIVLAFYATIASYLSNGPFWVDYEVEPICQKYWWTNLLYINNFNTEGQCLGWSWYLANDMQFFVFSPLFLISLWRWPKIGYSLLSLVILASCVANFVITYHYNLLAGSLSNVAEIGKDPTFIIRFAEYFSKIYGKPYTRCGPYLIGIALGYLLFKRKITHFKVNNVTLWIGWLLAIPVSLACVYGLYKRQPDLIAASFYNALTRPAYALCLCWLIFVCLIGKGGPVDKILSYKLFIPLSRLTYCAYLIHLIIIGNYFQSIQTTFDFAHQSMVLLFLGLITVTYAVSLVVSLVFESPIIRLEKYIRGKFQS